MWVGRVTHLANHQVQAPFRDSVASRAMANTQRTSSAQRRGSAPIRRRRAELRPIDLGGHCLRQRGKYWSCVVCLRKSTTWNAIAPQRCTGDAAVRWAKKAEALAQHGVIDGGGHRRMLSGQVMWCARCGAYATDTARGLAAPCPGKIQRWAGGGRGQQLRALMDNRHPRTGAALEAPCPEPRWKLEEGTDVLSTRTARRVAHATPSGHAVPAAAATQGGRAPPNAARATTGQSRLEAIKLRILAKRQPATDEAAMLAQGVPVAAREAAADSSLASDALASEPDTGTGMHKRPRRSGPCVHGSAARATEHDLTVSPLPARRRDAKRQSDALADVSGSPAAASRRRVNPEGAGLQASSSSGRATSQASLHTGDTTTATGHERPSSSGRHSRGFAHAFGSMAASPKRRRTR